MIKTVAIYLMLVADTQQCGSTLDLKCIAIRNACPQIRHYEFLKTKKDLEHEANMCYITGSDTKIYKEYKRKLK